MPTLLVTKKMEPALAARVEASVRGLRAGARARRPILAPFLRPALAVLVVAAAAWIVHAKREDRRRLEDARSSLLRELDAKRAALAPGGDALPSRIDAWLSRARGAYEGDFVATELRAPGALADVLAREAVYVRAPIEPLSDAARAAAASTKDALLLCLVAPPESRGEKALVAKARAACSAEILDRTTHVHGLGAAERGLAFLRPAWTNEVAGAQRVEDIDALRKAFERAPIDEATRATRAKLLIAALDEAGDGRGPTELDGERPHDVRVHLVDLASSTTLLRLRRHVDPGGISPGLRATHASGIDGCALALDVRDALADGRAAR